MRRWTAPLVLFAIFALGALSPIRAADEPATRDATETPTWQRDFHLDQRHFVSRGHNDYFVLEPRFQLVLEAPNAKLVISVLDDTVKVGSVMTRVVEEREWEDGKLTEVSRNFFAMDRDTHDIFYFGEDVTIYENEAPHHGNDSWRADNAGARGGLMMPGAPEVGMKYYQELAPGVAMDRATIASLSESFETPAGTFEKCLRTGEGSGLNPDENEFKTYAPGIGLIQDENLLLTGYGFSKK
jgi:hypothetical protein